MKYFSQSFFDKKCHTAFPQTMGWYTVGMRWLMITMLIVAWGCGKSPVSELQPEVTFDLAKPARIELGVLGEPGLWKQDNMLVFPNAETNRFTATTQESWALRGNLLLLETEISGEQPGYELVVKNYNASAATNRYRCTWFYDDGLVRGYAGQWRPKQARMDWLPLYLSGAAKGFDIQMTEISTGPMKKQLDFQITINGKVTLSGLFKAKHAGNNVRPEEGSDPASKELGRLGRGGIWKETQTVSEGGATKNLELLNRMRWSRGGKFLINEGVVNQEGASEYFMWVKTWDAEDDVYRWAYFFQNGSIEHFTGRWDAAKQLITWHLVWPVSDLGKVLRERFLGPEKRSWTFEVQNASGIIATGSGGSQFKGNAE